MAQRNEFKKYNWLGYQGELKTITLDTLALRNKDPIRITDLKAKGRFRHIVYDTHEEWWSYSTCIVIKIEEKYYFRNKAVDFSFTTNRALDAALGHNWKNAQGLAEDNWDELFKDPHNNHEF